LDTSTGALSPRSTLAATDVRMAAPLAGATNTVIYMTLWSGQSANVVFASSPACEEVSLHETVLAADGTTTMRPVTSITLQPNLPVTLTSGSIHLMCGNPDPSIAVGDLIPLR